MEKTLNGSLAEFRISSGSLIRISGHSIKSILKDLQISFIDRSLSIL